MKKRVKKNKKIIVIIILFILILLGCLWLLNSNKQDKVYVPNVIGMTSSKAYDKLTKKELTVKIEETVDETKKEYGKVYDQNIADKKVKKNTTIIIKVYVSKEEVKMPNVIGMDKEEAREILIKLGFNVSLKEEETKDYNDNIVFKQKASNPKKIVKGSTIILTYAKKIEDNEDEPEEMEEDKKDDKNESESSWSDWMTSLPKGITSQKYEIDKKTQYRSRTKETTTSQSPLSGWNLVDQKNNTTVIDHGMEYVEENQYNTMKNNSKYIISYATPHKYRVKYIHCAKKENNRWTASVYNPQTGCPSGYETHSYTKDIYVYAQPGSTIKGSMCPYSNMVTEDYVSSCVQLYQVWYKENQTTTTYYYERWTNWSNWQDNKITANDKTGVETRIVYRYKKK